MSFFRRVLRSAPLHFLILGGALYLLMPGETGETARAPVVIDEARADAVAASWTAATGRPPSETELRHLLERERDEEILFREAVRYGVHLVDPVIRQRMLLNMGFLYPDDQRSEDELFEEALALELHLNDTVIRRRMIQVVELSIESEARAQPIDEASRAEAYRNRRDEFVTPLRLRVAQVYFSRDRRANPQADAEALLSGLTKENTGNDIEETIRQGDAFLGGHRLPLYSERQIDAQFGPGFGASAAQCAVQAWCGPIESAYGFHLLWVESREDPRQLALDDPDVRRRLDADIGRDRAAAVMAAALTRLRAQYGVSP